MSSPRDAAGLDLRGAFDFAIMVEEDAQVRYEQLAALVDGEPGGAADVFRAMAVNEAKHRCDLEAQRAAVFRDAPPRIHVSVLDPAVERPDPGAELPRTAREALLLALGAEQRAFDFYRAALALVEDPAVRYFFQQLMDEEAEHIALLAAKLARFEAPAGRREPPPPVPRRAPPPLTDDAPYPDRALVEAALPRFDAATQAVARCVLLQAMPQDEVAAALGVSRQTVARKLRRFVELAYAAARPQA